MPVFYRGPCARITHQVFDVHAPEPRRFALSGLRGVHIVCVEPRGGGGDTAVARLYTTGTAGVAVVAAWPVLGSTPIAVAATVATAVLLGARGCWRTRIHSYELHGLYEGTLQVLFRSTDERTFGQVGRALLRAMQYAADDTN